MHLPKLSELKPEKKKKNQTKKQIPCEQSLFNPSLKKRRKGSAGRVSKKRWGWNKEKRGQPNPFLSTAKFCVFFPSMPGRSRENKAPTNSPLDFVIVQ